MADKVYSEIISQIINQYSDNYSSKETNLLSKSGNFNAVIAEYLFKKAPEDCLIKNDVDTLISIATECAKNLKNFILNNKFIILIIFF